MSDPSATSASRERLRKRQKRDPSSRRATALLRREWIPVGRNCPDPCMSCFDQGCNVPWRVSTHCAKLNGNNRMTFSFRHAAHPFGTDEKCHNAPSARLTMKPKPRACCSSCETHFLSGSHSPGKRTSEREWSEGDVLYSSSQTIHHRQAMRAGRMSQYLGRTNEEQKVTDSAKTVIRKNIFVKPN